MNDLLIEFQSRMKTWDGQSPGPKELVHKFVSDVIQAVTTELLALVAKPYTSRQLLSTDVLRVMRRYCRQWDDLATKYSSLFKKDALRQSLKRTYGKHGSEDEICRTIAEYL